MLALTLTALILVPSAAHLFELPAKIGLGRDAYFGVQRLYDGWALFGIPIVGGDRGERDPLFVVLRREDPAAARWALRIGRADRRKPGDLLHLDVPGQQATANWTQGAGDLGEPQAGLGVLPRGQRGGGLRRLPGHRDGDGEAMRRGRIPCRAAS